MTTLFPLSSPLPPGFSYKPDFITAAEEKELLTQISGIALNTFVFQGYEAKRKVASFGFDWSFEKRALKKGQPIPDMFQGLIHRVAAHLHLDTEAFAELLVT